MVEPLRQKARVAGAPASRRLVVAHQGVHLAGETPALPGSTPKAN